MKMSPLFVVLAFVLSACGSNSEKLIDTKSVTASVASEKKPLVTVEQAMKVRETVMVPFFYKLNGVVGIGVGGDEKGNANTRIYCKTKNCMLALTYLLKNAEFENGVKIKLIFSPNPIVAQAASALPTKTPLESVTFEEAKEVQETLIKPSLVTSRMQGVFGSGVGGDSMGSFNARVYCETNECKNYLDYLTRGVKFNGVELEVVKSSVPSAQTD